MLHQQNQAVSEISSRFDKLAVAVYGISEFRCTDKIGITMQYVNYYLATCVIIAQVAIRRVRPLPLVLTLDLSTSNLR